MSEENTMHIDDVAVAIRKFAQRRRVRVIGFAIYSALLLTTGTIGGCKIGRHTRETPVGSTRSAANGSELQSISDMDEFRDVVSGERERDAENFKQTKADVDSVLDDLLRYFGRNDSLSGCKEELDADKHVQN